MEASVNRLHLSDLKPEEGRVVLKYRYHPGWRDVRGGVIQRAPVPGDACGFIELVDPPAETTLVFDARAALFAPWPAGDEVRTAPADQKSSRDLVQGRNHPGNLLRGVVVQASDP